MISANKNLKDSLACVYAGRAQPAGIKTCQHCGGISPMAVDVISPDKLRKKTVCQSCSKLGDKLWKKRK